MNIEIAGITFPYSHTGSCARTGDIIIGMTKYYKSPLRFGNEMRIVLDALRTDSNTFEIKIPSMDVIIDCDAYSCHIDPDGNGYEVVLEVTAIAINGKRDTRAVYELLHDIREQGKS